MTFSFELSLPAASSHDIWTCSASLPSSAEKYSIKHFWVKGFCTSPIPLRKKIQVTKIASVWSHLYFWILCVEKVVTSQQKFSLARFPTYILAVCIIYIYILPSKFRCPRRPRKKKTKKIQCYLGDGGLAVEELEAPDLEEPFLPNGRDHSEIRFSSGFPASPSAPRNQSSKALQKKYRFRWEGFGWVLDRFLLKFWSLKIETELETTSPRAVRSSRLHPLPDEVPRAFAGLRGRCIVRTHQCWFLVRSFLPVPNDGKCVHKNRPEITTGVPCSFKAFARSLRLVRDHWGNKKHIETF